MDKHLLEYIEIKDFKCFKDFKAEGFKRVNLIGGKNNVGKTAFMEACFLNSSVNDIYIQSFIKILISIEVSRDYALIYDLSNSNNNEYIKLIISMLNKYHNSSFNSHLNNISILFEKEIIIQLNDKRYMADDLNYLFNETTIPRAYNFISSLYISSEQLDDLYAGAKTARKRKEIDKFINNFDSDLIEYDIIKDAPVCFSKSLNSYVNLNEYGNGLKRYIAFVCAIWANEDGCIFIDEIENGVHYSHLDMLWKVILETSRDARCQVFATTHSKESIESYARVSKKLDDRDISFIELGKNKNNELKSLVLDYDMFQSEITQNHEVRGW